MTTFLIIYLLGFIIAYYVSRATLKYVLREEYNWDHFFVAMIHAVFSWITLVIFLIAYAVDLFEDIRSKIKFKLRFPEKPPKWL